MTRILVLDDEVVIRRLMCENVVKSQGYAVEVGERVRAFLADGAAVPTIRQEVQR